jgi:hypothetical protein
MFAKETYRYRHPPSHMTNEEIMDGYNNIWLTQGRHTIKQAQYVDELIDALMTANRESNWDE